jgi:hypothetical protein
MDIRVEVEQQESDSSSLSESRNLDESLNGLVLASFDHCRDFVRSLKLARIPKDKSALNGVILLSSVNLVLQLNLFIRILFFSTTLMSSYPREVFLILLWAPVIRLDYKTTEDYITSRLHFYRIIKIKNHKCKDWLTWGVNDKYLVSTFIRVFSFIATSFEFQDDDFIRWVSGQLLLIICLLYSAGQLLNHSLIVTTTMKKCDCYGYHRYLQMLGEAVSSGAISWFSYVVLHHYSESEFIVFVAWSHIIVQVGQVFVSCCLLKLIVKPEEI